MCISLPNNPESYSDIPDDILDSLLMKRQKQEQTSGSHQSSKIRPGAPNKFSEPKITNLLNQVAPMVNLSQKETRYIEFKCWNCDKTGHRHRLCPEPRRRFCYGCRASGVTKRECPHCNKGNS